MSLAPSRLRPWEFTVDRPEVAVDTAMLGHDAARRLYLGDAALVDRVGWFLEPLNPRREWRRGLVLVDAQRNRACGWVQTEGRVLIPTLVSLGIHPGLRGWRLVLGDVPEEDDEEWTELLL